MLSTYGEEIEIHYHKEEERYKQEKANGNQRPS